MLWNLRQRVRHRLGGRYRAMNVQKIIYWGKWKFWRRTIWLRAKQLRSVLVSIQMDWQQYDRAWRSGKQWSDRHDTVGWMGIHYCGLLHDIDYQVILINPDTWTHVSNSHSVGSCTHWWLVGDPRVFLQSVGFDSYQQLYEVAMLWREQETTELFRQTAIFMPSLPSDHHVIIMGWLNAWFSENGVHVTCL